MLSPQGWCEMVDVGGSSAQGGLVDGGVPHQVILQVHDWLGTPDEQQAVVVVQLADFIWGQQLSAGHLEVGGPGTASALCFAMGLCVDGGLAQHLGDVLVGAGLIAAQIKDAVRVAGNGLPGILVQFLDLCHVLNDRAGRDVSASHGGQLPGKARKGHGCKLIQHKVNVPGQGTMMDLVGTVIQRLKHLRIQQGH